MAVSFQAESWIWYTVCITAVIARIISRRLLLNSWKRLQSDDLLMIFAVLPYTAMTVALNYSAMLGSNVIPPEEVPDIDPADVPNLVKGSKFAVVGDICANTTTWIVKGCILILYARVTTHLRQRIYVKIIGAYVVMSYVVMEILFLTYWCRPIQNQWKIPAPDPECATYFKHILLNTVFNISSDLMIVAIILPVIVRLQLPLKKKIILVGIFSLGLFTIVATFMNRLYNLLDPYGDSWVMWYLREPSTAVLVANLPHLWPLMQRIFHFGAFVAEMSGYKLSNSPPGPRSNTKGSSGGEGTWISLDKQGSDDVRLETLGPGKSGDATTVAERPLHIWRQKEVLIEEEAKPLSNSSRC